MKPLKNVEATRRAYHRDPVSDTVHRSSLIVPEIPGSTAEISFLNHFLLKRGYKNVACRITAVDRKGLKVDSRLHPVTEPRVYRFTLTTDKNRDVASYLVEFFSAENLFIPFPAVMVNHHTSQSFNSVHAYNRVLNDVFEDDSIGEASNAEASIDVDVVGKTDTFLVFSTGQMPVEDKIDVFLSSPGGVLQRSVPVSVPRFNNQRLSLKELFPEFTGIQPAILRVAQPRQPMFFGRMLAGRCREDGAWTANHSYYDSSSAAEYWDDARPAARLYPYFPGLLNRVRLYPITSPVQLDIDIALYDRSGREISRRTVGGIESPGKLFLDVAVEDVAPADLLGNIAAFAVIARPHTGNTPTRIGHQLVWKTDRGLPASINVVLLNPNVFVPSGKSGVCWGQAAVGGGVESQVGIVFGEPVGNAAEIGLSLYGPDGELAKRQWRLNAGASIVFNPEAEFEAELRAVDRRSVNYLWYMIHSERSDLYAFTVSRCIASGHCTGEHSF